MLNQINNDLVSALKEQNKFSLAVLRMLKSALQLESINKKSDLSDDEVIAVIKKQIKMRTDSITEFQKFNRVDEINNLEAEIAVLKAYLPQEMTEEEVNAKIDEAFKKVNPTSMKDMGTVMRELQSIASRTNMSIVSSKVKEKIMGL